MKNIIVILAVSILASMASAKDLKLLPDMSTAKVATAATAVKAKPYQMRQFLKLVEKHNLKLED
jgi:hypothetical protein